MSTARRLSEGFRSRAGRSLVLNNVCSSQSRTPTWLLSTPSESPSSPRVRPSPRRPPCHSASQSLTRFHLRFQTCNSLVVSVARGPKPRNPQPETSKKSSTSRCRFFTSSLSSEDLWARTRRGPILVSTVSLYCRLARFCSSDPELSFAFFHPDRPIYYNTMPLL